MYAANRRGSEYRASDVPRCSFVWEPRRGRGKGGGVLFLVFMLEGVSTQWLRLCDGFTVLRHGADAVSGDEEHKETIYDPPSYTRASKGFFLHFQTLPHCLENDGGRMQWVSEETQGPCLV